MYLLTSNCDACHSLVWDIVIEEWWNRDVVRLNVNTWGSDPCVAHCILFVFLDSAPISAADKKFSFFIIKNPFLLLFGSQLLWYCLTMYLDGRSSSACPRLQGLYFVRAVFTEHLVKHFSVHHPPLSINLFQRNLIHAMKKYFYVDESRRYGHRLRYSIVVSRGYSAVSFRLLRIVLSVTPTQQLKPSSFFVSCDHDSHDLSLFSLICTPQLFFTSFRPHTG